MFIRSTADLQVAHIEVPVLTTCGWYDLDRAEPRPVPSGPVIGRFAAGPRRIAESCSARGSTPSRRRTRASASSGITPAPTDSICPDAPFASCRSGCATTTPTSRSRRTSSWAATSGATPPNGRRPAPVRELFLSSAVVPTGTAATAIWSGTRCRRAARSLRLRPARPDAVVRWPLLRHRRVLLGAVRPATSVEQRADVLVYTSAAMVEALEIAGEAALRLHVSRARSTPTSSPSSATSIRAGCRTTSPTGSSAAGGATAPMGRRALTPGQIEELVLELGAVAHAFLPGHRIRLQVTSSAFPAWDRNMNTGHPLGSDAAGIVATQTVYHGGTHPSALLLPVPPRPERCSRRGAMASVGAGTATTSTTAPLTRQARGEQTRHHAQCAWRRLAARRHCDHSSTRHDPGDQCRCNEMTTSNACRQRSTTSTRPWGPTSSTRSTSVCSRDARWRRPRPTAATRSCRATPT